MLTELISTLLQVLVFALIPFLVYWGSQRKKTSFWKYIGLTPSPLKPVLLALLFVLPNLLLAYAGLHHFPPLQELLNDPSSMTGKMRALGPGWETGVIILMTAGIKTALAEEILFRGFIAKRLINWLGFWPGNLLQSFLFGLIHLLLFLTITDHWGVLTVIFLLPTLMALVMLYLNEKMAKGSILPGWVAHAAGNLTAYSLFAFG